MTHKLLIKTHNKTGLKYLCYTQKEDHNSYHGSGLRWKRHIKKHGYDVSTFLILETDDFEVLKTKGLEFSKLYDVVDSNEWANMIPESGDGGSSTKNTIWITNGVNDKIIKNNRKIPEGWTKGRTNCIFNDSSNQKKFNSIKNQNYIKKIKVKKEKQKKILVKRTHSEAAFEISRRIYICENCNKKCLHHNYHKKHGKKCQKLLN